MPHVADNIYKYFQMSGVRSSQYVFEATEDAGWLGFAVGEQPHPTLSEVRRWSERVVPRKHIGEGTAPASRLCIPPKG